MKTMYKTGHWTKNLIDKVEIERKTEYNIWANGRKHNICTEYSQYWDTFDEAKEYLMNKFIASKVLAESRLEKAKNNIVKLELLKK